MIVQILIVIVITALGMIGGQCHKYTRRYILPTVASAYMRKKGFKATIYLLLMGILSMGYGQNSKLRKICRTDTLTRIVYGILVSIPFLLFGKYYAIIVLPLAWSVRAGGFEITPGKHFLYEDLCRFLTIGLLVVI